MEYQPKLNEKHIPFLDHISSFESTSYKNVLGYSHQLFHFLLFYIYQLLLFTSEQISFHTIFQNEFDSTLFEKRFLSQIFHFKWIQSYLQPFNYQNPLSVTSFCRSSLYNVFWFLYPYRHKKQHCYLFLGSQLHNKVWDKKRSLFEKTFLSELKNYIPKEVGTVWYKKLMSHKHFFQNLLCNSFYSYTNRIHITLTIFA